MIFYLITIAYCSLAAFAIFKLYRFMNPVETHHMVDEDSDFYGDCVDPEILEYEKWEDLNNDIVSGLSINN